MNDTLALVRSLDRDQPDLHAPTTIDSSGAQPTLTDRLELRIAVWLLLRGARRRGAAHDHQQRQQDIFHSRARSAREHDALRVHALRSVRT